MESLLLAIMPAAAGTSFKKRSGVLLQWSHSNPDSKHFCLAMHLLNEYCATVSQTVFTVLL